MSEHIESQKVEKKKRKKAPFFVVIILALSGFMLARGVVAASTDITLNGATALFGGEDLGATSCDESITLRRTPVLNASNNIFEIASISISEINQNEVGGCGNQTLRLAVNLGNGTVTQASWSIPSTSTPGTFYLNSVTNRSTGGSYYADVLLTPFNAGLSSSGSYAVNIFKN
jgi:hypothetical protein